MPIQLHDKLSVEQRPIAPLILVGNVCNMRRCSRVGQYIECTGNDKLYYMQYGFVALYLSFVCVKAGFIFL